MVPLNYLSSGNLDLRQLSSNCISHRRTRFNVDDNEFEIPLNEAKQTELNAFRIGFKRSLSLFHASQ